MKPTRCTFDPRNYVGLAIGMFHCPECGEMVLAGVEHPGELEESDFDELDRLNALTDSELEEEQRKRDSSTDDVGF
jgi:transcription initiation factor IIE alpha subunit